MKSTATETASRLPNVISNLEYEERVLQERIDAAADATVRLEQVRVALGALRGEQKTSPPSRKATGKPAAKRLDAAPSKAPKKATKQPSLKVAVDEPRVVKGKTPTKGIQAHACSSPEDRRAKVMKLIDDGYKRVRPGEKILPGIFDVRVDRDGEATVLWCEKAEG